jgi:excinuclease ABC subunit A
VATVTEIYDYLRLLLARLGTPHCYRCGEPIRQQSPEEILDRLMSLPEGSKLMILSPLVRGRKGQHAETFETIRKAGFVRARIDGQVYELEALPELARQKTHTIEAVVDRIVIRQAARGRIAESLRLAIQHGDGVVIVSQLTGGAGGTATDWRDELFSTRYACPNCKLSYQELEPRTFSFNSPYGACPTCEGLGYRIEFEPELIAPDESLSLANGGIVPWREAPPAALRRYKQALSNYGTLHDFRWNTPLARLPPKVRRGLLAGEDDFPGVIGLMTADYESGDEAVRERLAAFRSQVPCPDCGGARLRPEALSVRLGDKAVHQITAQTVIQAREFFSGLQFAVDDRPISQPLVGEIAARLEFLHKVGLEYLTLDRSAATLSGGESQRIRLATGIGSGLVGVCYVLDEPSMGLHPRDNDRLIEALRDLQARGNSVLVVEHDEAIMRRADHLIDLGPGAGLHGGRVVSQGTPAEVSRDAASLTGRYLSGEASIAVPAKRRRLSLTKRAIALEGATANNLQNVSVRFPLGALVCVTGVSGSGKSSLLNETLAKAVARTLGVAGAKPGPYAVLKGVQQIDKLVEVDQSPIGRTPRSNPVTYIGVFDEIRKVYVATRESRLRGYKAGRFSFNVKGGRCEECQGQGLKKIEMNFLPDLYVTCPVCQGRRFNRQTLEVRYKGKSIAEALDMRVEEALVFFENIPPIQRPLAGLHEVGLGYLTLGQSSTTLSGGEAQRIKLAAELNRPDTGQTLYILDEPTTGLHFDDIRKLLLVLNRLVDLGNSVIVIEHHLDVIKSADWLIDLGPEGGAGGGRVVAEGTPEEVAAIDDNATGRYLRPLLRAR